MTPSSFACGRALIFRPPGNFRVRPAGLSPFSSSEVSYRLSSRAPYVSSSGTRRAISGGGRRWTSRNLVGAHADACCFSHC
jgi:hypothetical protein